MPVEELAKHLREVLAEAQGWVPANLAHTHLNLVVGGAVSQDLFNAAAALLIVRRHAQMEADSLRYTEPDFPELQLYDPILRQLSLPEVLDLLDATADTSVLENVAQGGPISLGQWAQPDLLLASIRRRRFDPARILEVTSFEVKCRAGAVLTAVYEALAHTRFVHRAYLVRPKSERVSHQPDRVFDACQLHGIGLIEFPLAVGENNLPAVGQVDIRLRAVWNDVAPALLEVFLNGRLSDAGKTRLEGMARP